MNLNHSEINKRIGKAIAKYRQESGLTQEQVAEIFQCTAADLLAEGSPRLFDKTHKIHLLISDLAEADRQLMLHFLEQFGSRLKRSAAQAV